MPFLRRRPGPLRSNLLGARRLQRLQGSGKKALSLGIYFFSFFFFSYWYLSLFFRGEKKPPKTNQPPKNPKHTQRPPRTESPGRYLSNARNTERSVISVGRLFVKRPAAAAGGSPTKGALRAGPTPPRCGSRRSPPPAGGAGGGPTRGARSRRRIRPHHLPAPRARSGAAAVPRRAAGLRLAGRRCLRGRSVGSVPRRPPRRGNPGAGTAEKRRRGQRSLPSPPAPRDGPLPPGRTAATSARGPAARPGGAKNRVLPPRRRPPNPRLPHSPGPAALSAPAAGAAGAGAAGGGGAAPGSCAGCGAAEPPPPPPPLAPSFPGPPAPPPRPARLPGP